MIRKKSPNYAVGVNKKYIYNGLQTAITANGGFSIEENAKPMYLHVIENIAKYDVTDSVQLLFDVETFNSKLGDYDVLNETFEMNSIMIYASEFTYGLKSMEQINSVGRLENFYKDFVNHVNDFLNYEEGFSSIYLIDEEFEVEKEKMEIVDLYETLIRKSENAYGKYDDLYGNITVNGTNNILKYMKNLNIFGNRNGVVNPGFIEGDLIYVPYGLTITISVDLNAENLQLNKKGVEYLKKMNEKNDYDNGNGSQETHTNTEKITRIVKIPLLMKLVNIPKPEIMIVEPANVVVHDVGTETENIKTSYETITVGNEPGNTVTEYSETGLTRPTIPTRLTGPTGPTGLMSKNKIEDIKISVPKILKTIDKNLPDKVVKKQIVKPLIQTIQLPPEITKPIQQTIKPLQKENKLIVKKNETKPPTPTKKTSFVATTTQIPPKPSSPPVKKQETKKNIPTRKTSSPKRIAIVSSTRKISQTGITGTTIIKSFVNTSIVAVTGPTGPVGINETNTKSLTGTIIINGPTGSNIIELPKVEIITPKVERNEKTIENIFAEKPEIEEELQLFNSKIIIPEKNNFSSVSEFLEEKQNANKGEPKPQPQPEPQQEEDPQEQPREKKQKIHIVSSNLNIYKKQLKLKRTDITNLFNKKK